MKNILLATLWVVCFILAVTANIATLGILLMAVPAFLLMRYGYKHGLADREKDYIKKQSRNSMLTYKQNFERDN